MDLILVSNQKLSTKAEPLHRVHSSHANGRRGGWVRRALRAAAIPRRATSRRPATAADMWSGRRPSTTPSITCIASPRKHKHVAVYRKGERAERGQAALDEAAKALGVSLVRPLIGVLPASQHCKGALYVKRTADLRRPEVVNEAKKRRKRSPPRPPSEDQWTLPIDIQ